MTKNKLPKLIILDWDNTLINTKPAFLKTINFIMEKYNFPEWNITREKYGDTTKSLKENFPIIFKDNAEKAYNDYLEYYKNYGYKLIEANEYASSFLKKLKELDIKFCIITNKDKVLLNNEVKKCFPNVDFTHILANGDTKNNKPSADPVLKVMEDFDFELNIENVWLIGDSESDLQCAINANCKPILYGIDKNNICKNYKNSCNYNTFEDIIEIL